MTSFDACAPDRCASLLCPEWPGESRIRGVTAVPHNKSCKKRVKTNEARRQRNVARRSRMRHALRDSRKLVQGAAGALSEEQLEQLKAIDFGQAAEPDSP